jgi:hypothetical protein
MAFSKQGPKNLLIASNDKTLDWLNKTKRTSMYENDDGENPGGKGE